MWDSLKKVLRRLLNVFHHVFPPFSHFLTFFMKKIIPHFFLYLFFLGIPVTALREIVLLRQLEHPNVVKLENVVMDPARLYLVFELVDTGERRERERE